MNANTPAANTDTDPDTAFLWEYDLDPCDTHGVDLRSLRIDLVLGRTPDPRVVLAVLDILSNTVKQARADADAFEEKAYTAEDEADDLRRELADARSTLTNIRAVLDNIRAALGPYP